MRYIDGLLHNCLGTHVRFMCCWSLGADKNVEAKLETLCARGMRETSTLV